MLVDTVKKYYNESYNFNCAETILYAANEEYEMDLDKNTFKTVAAFGGGMAIEETCGALTGALTVLSLLYVNDKAKESDRIKELTREFFSKFKNKLSTDNCRKLKEMYRDDEIRCSKIVIASAEVLDEIVSREGIEKQVVK